MVTVEQLYKDFGVLADAKDKACEHEKEYLSILSAVKGGQSEKRLASQFIARFYKHFTKLSVEAINALFDLCEDDDVNIRKQAIKDLPSLCRVTTECVPKISEALTQLLQCDDSGELSLVQSSLITLLGINAKGTIEGVFVHIHGDDDVLREKAIKFLTNKIRTLPEEAINKDIEDFLIAECKKVLQDVTKDEFIDFMNLLMSLQSMKTVSGRQQLVDIVKEQAELDQPFESTDSDCVDRLIQCIKQAAPLFSKNVHSVAFCVYMMDNVLPSLSKLASPDEAVNVQLEILKLFAEISEFSGDIENIEDRLGKVYDPLLEHMPLPPTEENDDLSTTTEQPKLKFSHVECLLYAFHHVGRKCPGFLADEQNAEKLKDFKLRLQYFARGVQVYIRQLKASLEGKTGETLRTEENKLKVVALKTTTNINTLVKDLLHNPPAYKSVVTLSWRPIGMKSPTSSNDHNIAGTKRITPITFDTNGSEKKSPKVDQTLYAPPGGKFSEKAGTYQGDTETRGGRGRGGGFRSRGGYNRGRRF